MCRLCEGPQTPIDWVAPVSAAQQTPVVKESLTTQGAQHTPGPWRVDAPGYSSHEFYINVEWQGRGGPKFHGSAGAIAKLPPSKFHNQAANARLIAEAPEMAALLREVLALVDWFGNMGQSDAIRAVLGKVDGSAA